MLMSCGIINWAQDESNELEKIQNEAARTVTGTTKLVSITGNSLLLKTGLETLASRRKKHKLSTLFYKTEKDLSPDYLRSLAPASTSSYPLCNASNLQTVHATCNSQLYCVVQCGGRNMSPRTSTIVQFLFYIWSFEINVNILKNQK